MGISRRGMKMTPIKADLLRTQATISKKTTMVKVSAVQISRARFGMLSTVASRSCRTSLL